MSYAVTLIPGDGIGPELAEATRHVLEATGIGFEWDVQEAGEATIAAEDERGRVGLVLAGVLRCGAVDRLEDGGLLADVRARRDPEAADQPGGKVAHDVAVQVRQHENVVQLRLLDQLHAHVVDDPVLEADASLVLGRDLLTALEEEAVRELHDVRLVDRGDLAATVLHRVLEGVARDPLRRGAGDDLDALRGVGPDTVLDPGVEILGVLAHDDQVDVVVAGLDALHRSRRADVGVQFQRLAQRDIHRAEATADRGRDGSLDRHAVLSDRLDDAVRQRSALASDRRLARFLDVPFEADAGCLEHDPRGLRQLGADPVAGDQSDDIAHGGTPSRGRSKRRRTGVQSRPSGSAPPGCLGGRGRRAALAGSV